MQQHISLIIPCYNESENIDTLVSRLNEYFAGCKNLAMEIVFVDDCSSDDTFARLTAAKHEHYKAKIIRLARNGGSHIAFRAGLLHTSNDIVTQTSGDLQHPLSLVEDMYDSMQANNTPMVVAFRRNPPQMNFFTKTFSKSYAYLIRKYAVPNYPSEGFDLFMINGKVKQLMNENIENNSSILLQLLSFGLPMSSVYYDKMERLHGKSKWTLKKKIKLLIDSFVAFSYAPIRLVSIVGISFFFFGLAWTIYIIFRKLVYNDLASGWPALVSILMIGFGLTNISLGIIAEYLWRTLDASRKRPVFIIDKIIEAGKSN